MPLNIKVVHDTSEVERCAATHVCFFDIFPKTAVGWTLNGSYEHFEMIETQSNKKELRPLFVYLVQLRRSEDSRIDVAANVEGNSASMFDVIRFFVSPATAVHTIKCSQEFQLVSMRYQV